MKMTKVRMLLLGCATLGLSMPMVSAAPTVEELQAHVKRLEAENEVLRKENAELRQAVAPAAPVNVNTATRQELEKVPGIGRAMAERIIAGRPYQSLDELKRIDGIGPKTLETARLHLTIGP